MSNSSYNLEDIVTAFSKAGLRKGDTAFFSTSLGMIGKAEGVNNSEDLNALFFNAIKIALGLEGTILVPAYSYSFGSSTKNSPKTFYPLTTPAETGPFPNFFLKQKNVIRSLDPMMSVAGLGPETESLFKNLPLTSYGEDSLFARLVNHPDTKCISIGLGPNWAPFLHHADWVAQVPFRFEKTFFGGINHPHRTEYINWTYDVRVPIDESRANAHELGKLAEENGIWKFSSLGRARVYACIYKDYFNFTIKQLQQNKWLTAIGPACEISDKY
jgi:aminoglycoside N3'-acetyltransferase